MCLFLSLFLLALSVDFEVPTDARLWISSDGGVVWAIPSVFTISCHIDARFFPFDTQRCRARFGSWVYPISQMDFVSRSVRTTSDARKFFIQNGIWDLASAEAHGHVTDYELYGRYPEVIYTIVLTRRPFFHVLTTIIPCAMLSLVNLMVFILPTESGEKVSLGITNVLALVLFQQLIGEHVPPTSDGMPFICKYVKTPT